MNVIDVSKIQYLRSLSADPSFLPVLIETFTRDTEAEISEMKQAYQRHDNQTLRHLAHKYKSSSKNMGAERLADLCLEVEKMVRDGKGDASSVADTIAQIEVEALLAVKELKNLG